MTFSEVAAALGIVRVPDESYYVFVQRVAQAYLDNSPADLAFVSDTHKTVVQELTKSLAESRRLNLGISNENAGLKKQLQEAHSGPYGRRADAIIPPDESRDPAKTFHYDIDPRARAVIRNGAYVLTIQPDDE